MVADAWNDFKVALAFLTRVPVDHAWDDESLAASAVMFPVVGALVGAAGALGYAAAVALGLPPWPAAVITLALTIGLTGALHEDGLADTADALGGATRDDRLRIMRDSRLGSYGAIAITLGLMIRVGAIAAFAEPLVVGAALVAAGAASRASLPAVMAALPPARRDGLAADAGRPPRARLLGAIALAMAMVALLLPPPGVLAVVAGATVATVAVAALARRQFGGHTGDVLGAVQQSSEITTLLTVLAVSAGSTR